MLGKPIGTTNPNHSSGKPLPMSSSTRYDVAKNYLGHLTRSGFCLVPEVQDLLRTEEDPWCRPSESPTGWEVVSQGFPALGPCRRSYLDLCQLWYPQSRSDHLYWENCHGYPGQSWKCRRPFG